MNENEFKGRLAYLKKMKANLEKQKEKIDEFISNINHCAYQTKEIYCNNKHNWHKYSDYYSKWQICQKCGLQQ